MPAGMMDDATEVGTADGSQVQVLLGPPPEGSTNTATLPQQQQQQLAPQPATATPTPGTVKSLIVNNPEQGLCQDLETGCPKLAIVKFLGI